MKKETAILSDGSKKWLEKVASGDLTMGQRSVAKIMKSDGNLESIIDEAKKYNLHLLKLTDDKGNILLAASKEEFIVLC